MNSLEGIKLQYGIVGNDAKLNSALDIAIKAAPTDLSVLVTGESGVGKEFIPKIIHANSKRKHSKYISINCGAIPEGTIDSELFGHEKGSFTGAIGSRKGYFEEVDGGTIFLDEVAELPLTTQARLLRVLQDKEFIRVGSSEVKKVNVRVIAATNVNLKDAIERGKFREDLYYRLNAISIEVPPLRERGGDISLLFRKFASNFATEYKMPKIELTESAKTLLRSYRWPGNVRQLQNVVGRISVLEECREIDRATLEKYLPNDGLIMHPTISGTSEQDTSELKSKIELLYQIVFKLSEDLENLKKEIRGEAIDSKTGVKALTEPKQDVIISNPDKDEADDLYFTEIEEIRGVDEQKVALENDLSIQNVNKDLIKQALAKHGGKRGPAAKELGISERTLYRKIKEWNI